MSGNVLDRRDPESERLEEELERIIMLADTINEKALSTVENLAENAATKKQKGKKSIKRSIASFVLRKSRKNLRSGCTDKSSMYLQRQPRLSPLAARAALAAAVTPLKQASQAKLFEKPQKLSVQSATWNASTSSINLAENDDRKLRVEACRNTSASVDYQPTSACFQILGPPVKETGISFSYQCNEDIQLFVDIPIHRDLLLEKADNFVIDLPLLGR